MRILFIGPYRQSDGWGNASKEYIRALKLTGHDITTKPIFLNRQTNYQENNEFVELEENLKPHYDVVIQNCLPDMFRKFGDCKNIGISFFESTIAHTPWIRTIGLLDRMWVSSIFDKASLVSSEDEAKEPNPVEHIDVIPIPTNVERYKKEFEYKHLLDKHKNEYKFYFIGEMISRKNIESIIKAFHLTFNREELARLVLKVNKVGADSQQALEMITSIVNTVKGELGLYEDDTLYKQQIVIPGFLTNETLDGLHKDCDCFVMPSSGEGFCIPALDALGFGSNLLVNVNSSVNQFTFHPSQRVLSYPTPAIAPDKPLNYLYNGRDYWYEIDLNDLMHKMREAYDNRHSFKSLVKENKTEIEAKLNRYSYESVAEKMKEALND